MLFIVNFRKWRKKIYDLSLPQFEYSSHPMHKQIPCMAQLKMC